MAKAVHAKLQPTTTARTTVLPPPQWCEFCNMRIALNEATTVRNGKVHHSYCLPKADAKHLREVDRDRQQKEALARNPRPASGGS